MGALGLQGQVSGSWGRGGRLLDTHPSKEKAEAERRTGTMSSVSSSQGVGVFLGKPKEGQ